jgi:preprotein translocase subunit SecG
MLLNILLALQIIVCVSLVGTVLLQRSEGGALGMGGGASGGFMTARGAGNLLTRTTAILATLFFLLSIGLTIVANFDRGQSSVIDRADPNALKISPVAPLRPAQAPSAPTPQGPAPSLSDLASPAAPAPTSSAPAQPAQAPAPQ